MISNTKLRSNKYSRRGGKKRNIYEKIREELQRSNDAFWRKGRKENMDKSEKICGYEIKAERQSKGLRGNANYFGVIVEYGRSTRKSTKGKREGNFHSRSRIQGPE